MLPSQSTGTAQMKILDANAILRYLLNDIEPQAEEVCKVIRDGAMTTTEVLAEVVYVLSGFYGMPRDDVSWYIHCLLLDVKVDNVKCLRYALGMFNQTNLDFVDCLLVAYRKVLDADVFSFGRKLNSNLGKDQMILQS